MRFSAKSPGANGGYALLVFFKTSSDFFSNSNVEIDRWRRDYSHIWSTQVCAAQQGILFTPLTDLEQGIESPVISGKGVYFTSV